MSTESPPAKKETPQQKRKRYAARRAEIRMMKKLGIPVPKPGGHRPGAGKPRFEPSLDQKKIVKLMLGMRRPMEVVAAAITNPHTGEPISVDLLKERFPHEIAVATAEMDALLSVNMAARIVKGSDTMMIWNSKNLWGWRDHPEPAPRQGRNGDEYGPDGLPNAGTVKIIKTIVVKGGLPVRSTEDQPEGTEYDDVPPEEPKK